MSATATKPSPTIVHNASTAPRRGAFKKSPDRHYLLCEPDQVTDYTDMISLTQPDSDDGMYRMESDDRRATGNAKLVLLSCSQEDYIEAQARNTMQAKYQADATGAEENQANVTDTLTQVHGGALTL